MGWRQELVVNGEGLWTEVDGLGLLGGAEEGRGRGGEEQRRGGAEEARSRGEVGQRR